VLSLGPDRQRALRNRVFYQTHRNRDWNDGYQGQEREGEMLVKEYKLPVIR